MIWTKRGCELDAKWKNIIDTDDDFPKYYVFGAGMIGKGLTSVLERYHCIIAFIDNNIKIQGNVIDGKEIISLEEYIDRKNGQIVVAVSAVNSEIIVKQLEEKGLKHGKNFWLYNEFVNYIFPIVSTYCYDNSYVSLAQISVTERCSLKCKKCAHGCFAVDNTSIDLTLQQVYSSADSFFSKVDFVYEFVLIGGEPLLYNNLAQAIQYVGIKYRKQIGIFSITTNGTVMPTDDVLNTCRKYNVLLRISNYSREIPKLTDKYRELEAILKKKEISYDLGKEEDGWMDYGFGCLERGERKDVLIKAFDECKTPCREVRENRFYYCVMARSVAENLGYNVGEEDYLDLNCLNEEKYKKELLEFNLGYSQKGYLDMCRYCRGAEARRYPIPAAEQVETNGKWRKLDGV